MFRKITKNNNVKGNIKQLFLANIIITKCRLPIFKYNTDNYQSTKQKFFFNNRFDEFCDVLWHYHFFSHSEASKITQNGLII